MSAGITADVVPEPILVPRVPVRKNASEKPTCSTSSCPCSRRTPRGLRSNPWPNGRDVPSSHVAASYSPTIRNRVTPSPKVETSTIVPPAEVVPS